MQSITSKREQGLFENTVKIKCYSLLQNSFKVTKLYNYIAGLEVKTIE